MPDTQQDEQSRRNDDQGRRNDDQSRRNDDQDRRLNERLGRLEMQQERTQASVVALESTVNLVKNEQGHMRETVELRLRMIEDSNKLQNAKLDDLRSLLATMMDSADKSPAGRELTAQVRDLAKLCADHSRQDEKIELELTHKIEEQDRKIRDLETYRNRVEGFIGWWQWLGWAGVAGLSLTVLRALKVVP